MRSRWLLAPQGAILLLLILLSTAMPTIAAKSPTPEMQLRVETSSLKTGSSAKLISMVKKRVS